MAGVNKAILLGNVGKDPEVRYLDNQRAVAKCPLATTHVYKGRDGARVETTEWHNLVFWSPLAEIVEKYVKKGTRLYVEGRISTRSYDDREGNKRYITEIEAREMQMVSTRGETNAAEEGMRDADEGAKQNPNQEATQVQKEGAQPGTEKTEEIEDDDLPF